jgi:hypothetical protein
MRLFSSSSLRASLHSAFANPSLAHCLLLQRVRHKISLRGVRRERRSAAKFSETKKKKIRYERIVVKCLLLVNLGNWTQAVLDLLWCQSWQFVVGISSHFFWLLRTFLQFHAGIAGMTCDVSSSLGKFRAGIAPIVMLPVLALLRRQCSICCVASLGHFSALIAGIVMLPSIGNFSQALLGF